MHCVTAQGITHDMADPRREGHLAALGQHAGRVLVEILRHADQRLVLHERVGVVHDGQQCAGVGEGDRLARLKWPHVAPNRAAPKQHTLQEVIGAYYVSGHQKDTTTIPGYAARSSRLC